MKLTLFGGTGFVGRECLRLALDRGHDLTLLVRSPDKLPEALRSQANVIQGDALERDSVAEAMPDGTQAVLFAIGIDKRSPEDLCTDITRHILAEMPRAGTKRLIWVGGGSTLVDRDHVTLGARFVELFATVFMGLRHRDKAHQLELLEANRQLEWIGLRPLQIRRGPETGQYRVGYDPFSGTSKISAGDVAHCMLELLDGDAWIHEAPIIQY